MSEIERIKEPQKLFRYGIDAHIKLDQGQRAHFYRMNRWRFNTFNRFNLLKYLKCKQAWVSIPIAISLDYIFGFYSNPEHH